MKNENKVKVRYGLRGLSVLLLAVTLLFTAAAPAYAAQETDARLVVTVKNAPGTVKIEALDGAPEPVTAELTLQGDGSFLMSFTEPGDYDYKITQIPGTKKGVTYDSTVYHLRVSVISDDEGKLSTQMTLSTEGSAHKPAACVFTNELPTPSPSPKPTRPKTGDESQPWLYASLFLLSAAGLCALAAAAKKQKS